jgi:hypothetical protein
VLVREGPPYRADGELDTASGQIIQVVVDNLVDCRNVTDAMDMKVTSSGSVATPSTSRDVDVTINQSGGVATSFSARIASNPLYAGMDMYEDTGGCPPDGIRYVGPNSRHFCLPFTTVSYVNAVQDKENVFYFKFGADAYTLKQDPVDSTPHCSYSSCRVWLKGTYTNALLKNADVLVFADRDLRLGP